MYSVCVYIYISQSCVCACARGMISFRLSQTTTTTHLVKKEKKIVFVLRGPQTRSPTLVCVSCLFLFGVRLFENRRRVVPRLCVCSRSFVRFPKTKNNSVCFSILIPIHLDSSWSIGSCDGSRDDELRNQSQIVNLSLLVGNLGQI